MPSLKFSVDPLYTFSGWGQTGRTGTGVGQWRREPVPQGERGAGPSCKMGGCDRDMISDIDFSFAVWVYCRSTQCEFPVDCRMFSEAKWIEQPQRVERFARNRL